MKGDFSRDTFDPTKHYNAVLMQQGRVQTDADWNEQTAIIRHLARSVAADVIGPSGAPHGREGFRLTPGGSVPGDYQIGAGHYYVDGILCENEGAVAASAQPDLVTRTGDNQQLLSPALPDEPGVYVAYLDVWQRHITALDDDLIREKALGGPDTTTRSQTVWQVRLLPIVPDPTEPAPFSRLFSSWQDRIVALRRARADEPFQRTLQTLQELITTQLKSLDQSVAQQETIDPRSVQAMIKAQHNLVESLLQLPGGTDATRAEVQKLSDEMIQAIVALHPSVRCSDPLDEWDALLAPPTGRLRARVNPVPADDDPCLIPPGSAFRGQENQLYRVEIHAGGTLQEGGDPVTFKWSRENGSVVTAVRATTELSGTADVTIASIPVQDVGPDEALGFASGQWVELVDDLTELHGQPGQLRQITEVVPATRQIELSQAVTLNMARRPRLRRWDSVNEVDARLAPEAVALESGIEVLFEAGSYRSGDYWLIPARTATGGIEWPPDPTAETPTPAALEPHGVRHRYARLAIAQYDGEDIVFVDDCRTVFPTLSDLAPPDSFHVVQISWANDDVFPIDQFLNLQTGGLLLRFDATPDPAAISGGTLAVFLEPSLAPGLALEGTIDVADKAVRWRPTDRTVTAVNQLNLFQAGRGVPRVRITLKGHTIWTSGPERVFLDGQVYGQPGLRADGKTPAVGLQLPSGDGRRASDFESWFYLAQLQQPATPLRTSTVSFLGNARGSEGTVATVVFGRSQDVPILRVADQIITLEITFSRAINIGPVNESGILPSIRVEALTQDQGPIIGRGTQPAPTDPGRAVFKLPGATSGTGTINIRKSGGVLGDEFLEAARVKITPVPTVLAAAGEVVRVRIRPPNIRIKVQPFPAGTYRLVISGDASASLRAVTAADDKTALDGDFDGKPGGTLILPFQIR